MTSRARAGGASGLASPRPGMRLDKWLWVARVFRARTLAAEGVAAGLVRVNGQRATKPGRDVRVGDVLTIRVGARVAVLQVAALAERRGPAEVARGLYREILDGRTAPDADGAPHARD